MSSDSDYSSESASEHKRQKLNKSKSVQKHKKKKSKKYEDKHKHKKCSKHEQDQFSTNKKTESIVNNEEAFSFGPPLPPHMLQRQLEDTSSINPTKQSIGPTMPKEFLKNIVLEAATDDKAETEPNKVEDDDEYDGYGPVPASERLNATQIELEQRALELKLAAIEGRNTNTVDVQIREEWMLELPAVGLRGGLAALNNMKRTFHQGKEKPDFSDRTDWTKTPQSSANEKKEPATNSKTAAEAQRREAKAAFTRKRDEEQERIANSHKKKDKLNESLVEMHQKKLRKEQRMKEKELLKNGEKPERRPFTRDVDLKLNKIDSHQTKKIVEKAKEFHSKFSSGHAKYL